MGRRPDTEMNPTAPWDLIELAGMYDFGYANLTPGGAWWSEELVLPDTHGLLMIDLGKIQDRIEEWWRKTDRWWVA